MFWCFRALELSCLFLCDIQRIVVSLSAAGGLVTAARFPACGGQRTVITHDFTRPQMSTHDSGLHRATGPHSTPRRWCHSLGCREIRVGFTMRTIIRYSVCILLYSSMINSTYFTVTNSESGSYRSQPGAKSQIPSTVDDDDDDDDDMLT